MTGLRAIDRRTFVGAAIVALAYLAARSAGWSGPHGTPRFEPWIWWGIAGITAWGLYRLARRTHP